jgi:hypothetical protein
LHLAAKLVGRSTKRKTSAQNERRLVIVCYFSQALRAAVFSTSLTALAARFSLSDFPAFFDWLGDEIALFAMNHPTGIRRSVVFLHAEQFVCLLSAGRSASTGLAPPFDSSFVSLFG